MARIEVSGSFGKTYKFLNKCSSGLITKASLLKYADAGLKALREYTPKNTGYTASCWYYTINEDHGHYSITYNNSNVINGQSVAILLQYGHASKNGSWVQGIDYINPALKPIFSKIVSDAWEEMRK